MRGPPHPAHPHHYHHPHPQHYPHRHGFQHQRAHSPPNRNWRMEAEQPVPRVILSASQVQTEVPTFSHHHHHHHHCHHHTLFVQKVLGERSVRAATPTLVVGDGGSGWVDVNSDDEMDFSKPMVFDEEPTKPSPSPPPQQPRVNAWKTPAQHRPEAPSPLCKTTNAVITVIFSMR